MNFSPFRKLVEHFSIVTGLLLAAMLITWIEARDRLNTFTFVGFGRSDPLVVVANAGAPELALPNVLTEVQMTAARTAWTYFESFTNPETGLSNSVETFPSGTMWDQGSYLVAILAAYRLQLISYDETRQRIQRVLAALIALPLVDGQLPNKVYNTTSLEMTFYNNTPAPTGLGWSALDIARLTVALKATAKQFPDFADEVATIETRWNVNRLVRDGELWGASRDPSGALVDLQEGRLGYEEYAARGIALLGLNPARAADWRYQAQNVEIEGIELLVDRRDKENSNGSNYTLSEPYLLTALEFGFDPETAQVAAALYRAQERRAERTGQLTAVSEDNVDRDPYFLYYSAFANGEEWMPISPAAIPYPDLATVSTKAAFGWHALYQSEYTQKLVDHVGVTQHAERGWRSGIFEKTGEINDVATANTNAMVLLAIHYQGFGPLLPAILRGAL
ncbi:MAG: DUF3131 domain-containing protein [Pseudomonadota bacterium]